MSESIVLDQPEQINMWVLLSRRSQLHLHMRGVKVPGLFAWLKANGITSARNPRKALLALNERIADLDGPMDEREQHYIIAVSKYSDHFVFWDQGIHKGVSFVKDNPAMTLAYTQGRVHLVMTDEDVRPALPKAYQFED